MASQMRSGTCRFRGLIPLLMIIIIYSVSAICSARPLGGSVQETGNEVPLAIFEENPDARENPRHEKNGNTTSPEALQPKRVRSTFELIYEMLPKGPVTPSGPSHSHNEFPRGRSGNDFPNRGSAAP